jgi:DNA-binding CsgD family transcriptional regulator
VEHLKIAYYLFVLLVGAAATAYAVLMGRAYRLPFLRPFAWFLVFNNLLALVNLTSAYACANLLGFCAGFGYTVFPKVLGPAARLAQVGIVYTLFAVAAGLRRRRLPRALSAAFAAVAAVLLTSYAVWAALPRGHAWWLTLARGQLAVFILGVLAILGVLVVLLLDARRIAVAAERRAVRLLGLAYFATYAVFIVTFRLPVGVQFFPNALALLAINVIPLVWFGRPFAAAFAAPPSAADDREAFAAFCRTRGLSARECDILGQLLRGKSSAQIEKELFISVHTVKNHITSIHRKLGVRSRWQLISLFHSGRPGRPAAGAPVPSAERVPERSPWHE